MRKPKNSNYTKALDVVQKIADAIDNRGLHFRDKNGRALFTLDEVIMAIMQDRLAILPR